MDFSDFPLDINDASFEQLMIAYEVFVATPDLPFTPAQQLDILDMLEFHIARAFVASL